MKPPRPLERLLIGAAVAGTVLTCQRRPPPVPPATAHVFRTDRASFELSSSGPTLMIRSADGVLTRAINLFLVVDESIQPFDLATWTVQDEPTGLRALVPVALGGADPLADLEVRADAARDAITVRLAPPEGPEARSHRFALRATTASEDSGIFVSGVGSVSERATVSGDVVVLESDPHPVAIGSALGSINAEILAEESLAPGEPMEVAVRSPSATSADHPVTELHFVVGQSPQAVWAALASLAGVATAPVRGRVTGVNDRAYVIGRDARGVPMIRAQTSAGGGFRLDASPAVVQWYAETSPGPATSYPSCPWRPWRSRIPCTSCAILSARHHSR